MAKKYTRYEPSFSNDARFSRDGLTMFGTQQTVSSVLSKRVSPNVSGNGRAATEWWGATVLATSLTRRKIIGRYLHLGTPSLKGNYLRIPWLNSRSSFHPTAWRNSRFSPDTQLRTNAINRLIDRRASLGESLAEARQTVSFLGQKSLVLFKALRDIRRGRFSKGLSRLGVRQKHLSGDLANRWLETQFAVIPLIEEVSNVYDIATTGLRTNISYLSSGSSSSETYESTFGYGGATIKISASLYYNCKLFCSLEDRAHGIARQLGLDAPVALAWDLVPFSFVVDWFAPVGDFLSATSGRSAFKFLDGYDSFKAIGTIEATNARNGYSSKGTFEIYKRKLLRSMPTPGFNLKSPLTTWKAVTAAALYRKVFY